MDFLFILFGILFAIVFMLFLLPVLGYVFNIGNITGMIFCVIMMCLFFGHNIAAKVIRQLWQSIFGKIALVLVSVIITSGFIYVGFLTSMIINADHTVPKKDAVVIVLGCQVRGETPSLMLMQRINAAEKYLKDNPDALCIVSGGKGDDEQISEAECMYRVLTKKGISEDRIFIEDASSNTVENIAFSKEIILRHGLSNNTAIVTDVFHEYRASQIVKNAGLEFGSVAAKCSWYLMPTFYVRELIAITAVYLGLV